MTFYNHIESVRGIAIDLTNGRKWRGASDKAAVFEALDAARREYMRLSDENAKLREQVERLRTQLADVTESVGRVEERRAKTFEVGKRWMAKAACFEAENAKLRELCEDMVDYGKGAGNGMAEFFADRMRELGVVE